MTLLQKMSKRYKIKEKLLDYTLKGLTFGLVMYLWFELPTASGPKSARVHCGC